MKMNITVVITVSEENVVHAQNLVQVLQEGLEYGISEYDPYYNFDVAVDKAKD